MKKGNKKNQAQKKDIGALHTRQAAAEELLEEMLPKETEATEETKEEKPQKNEEALSEELSFLKNIIKRLMDDLGISDIRALSEQIDKAEMQKLVAGHNLDEAGARLFLLQQEKLREVRREKEKEARRAEMESLKKEPLYKDILEKADAIEAYSFRTGASVKEAYNALFAEEKLRALLAGMDKSAAEKEKNAKKIPALSGGGAQDTGAHIKLSEAEVWAAANAGMTPAEYAKYKFLS